MTVPAPEGYEGVRFFEQGSRQWCASYRPTGERWFTNVALIGHQYHTPEELDRRATAAIERHITATKGA